MLARRDYISWILASHHWLPVKTRTIFWNTSPDLRGPYKHGSCTICFQFTLQNLKKHLLVEKYLYYRNNTIVRTVISTLATVSVIMLWVWAARLHQQHTLDGFFSISCVIFGSLAFTSVVLYFRLNLIQLNKQVHLMPINMIINFQKATLV